LFSFLCSDGGEGTEAKKEGAILFKAGHYYRKDRSEKVSGSISSVKNVKAAGKPIFPLGTDYERSATGKPNHILNAQLSGTVNCMDGLQTGILNPNVQGKKEGTRKAGKDEKERMTLLEQQLLVERGRREMAERMVAEEREKMAKENAIAQEAANGKIAMLTMEKNQLEERLKEEEDAAMDTMMEDVYVLEEDMIKAGPYYNVRAARTRAMDEEVILGDGRRKRMKEAPFNIQGEGRLDKVVWRHRLDVGQNITLSYNPASMTCSGCKTRGVHSVVGADDGRPVVLVATDQNFPPVLFSENDEPCIGIFRMEYGTAKELGFAVGDLLHGISLPEGSVILVGSPTDLGRQGIVGYTEELARSLRILKRNRGGRCWWWRCRRFRWVASTASQRYELWWRQSTGRRGWRGEQGSCWRRPGEKW